MPILPTTIIPPRVFFIRRLCLFRNRAAVVARALVEPVASSRTHLAGALRAAERLLTARALVIIVSDFDTDDERGAEIAIASLSRRHEVVPTVIRTPMAASLADLGPVRVRDPETGRATWIDVGPGRENSWLVDAAVRLGLTPISIDPGRPLAPQLAIRFGGRTVRQR